MKKFRLMFMVSAMMLFATACNTSSNRSANPSTGNESSNETQMTENAKYTCPMHPEVVSDQSGDCPKCGMALVKADSIPAMGTDSVAM